MIPAEAIDALRAGRRGDAGLEALLATVRGRVDRLLREPPPLPRGKAMLSRDGGICPADGRGLRFDPWSPDRHVCPACGQAHAGERHHAHWARAQYLWLGERMTDLALLAAVEEDRAAAARLDGLLAAVEACWQACPNRDNVLGPARLFFSTYLESLWMTHLLAAATLAREGGVLTPEGEERIGRIADEAAGLIAEFNEGMSNRQTWHAAALTAIAAWFGDDELAATAVEERTGLLGHLADGFGDDGLWYEGENYHLFALRGLITGLHWARLTGTDLLEAPELRAHFRAAMLAPSLTALPDLTYPARKDARYGVSLAQPSSLELFEVGRAWLGPDPDLDRWLAALYAAPAPPADHYDAWLHEAGLPPPATRGRSDLSPLVLLALSVPPVAPAGGWEGPSTLLAAQRLGVLRRGDRYVSLECGDAGGGHGHADRLHLTLHAGGTHWLPDPGAGSYVQDTLAWYRSAASHNVPLVNGALPGGEEPTRCEAFDVQGDWGWVRGRAGEVRRTVVTGPTWVLDVVELTAGTPGSLDVLWHLQGTVEAQPAALTARAGEATIRLLGAGDAPFAPLTGPGLPTEVGDRTYWARRAGSATRLVTVLDLAPNGSAAVTGFRAGEGAVEVTAAAGPVTVRFTAAGASVAGPGQPIALAGLRPAPAAPKPLMQPRPSWDAVGTAPPAWQPPALDGTLEGFDTSAPLTLEGEHQYRRSEEPWDGEFRADAWVNWDHEALYLAVAVSKPEIVIRPDDPEPLELDNDPEDIHADGLQLYHRPAGGPFRGVVVTLREDGSLRARPVGGTEPGGAIAGAWSATDDGYLVTLRLEDPALAIAREGDRLGFDLLVNEARADRLRRAGQLVWSGGEGWVYLRGDWQDPSRLGSLELG